MMNLKKIAEIGILGAMVAVSPIVGNTAYAETSSAPKTNNNYLMNLDQNPNYVLVYSHLGIGYYLDISSINIKQNDAKGRYWAQILVEVNMKTNEVGKYITQFYYYDRTDGATKKFNDSNKEWETIETYDPREAVQIESRGFSIGYLFAFQGGNPVNG